MLRIFVLMVLACFSKYLFSFNDIRCVSQLEPAMHNDYDGMVPEFNRARQEFVSSYYAKQNQISDHRDLKKIKSMDFINIGEDHFKPSHLPFIEGGFWGQAKSKVITKFGDSDLVIKKFAPRRRKEISQTISLPKAKLWHFNYQGKNFIWCEFFHEDLREAEACWLDKELLQNLDFLKDFISPDLALEFGWNKKRFN